MRPLWVYGGVNSRDHEWEQGKHALLMAERIVRMGNDFPEVTIFLVASQAVCEIFAQGTRGNLVIIGYKKGLHHPCVRTSGDEVSILVRSAMNEGGFLNLSPGPVPRPSASSNWIQPWTLLPNELGAVFFTPQPGLFREWQDLSAHGDHGMLCPTGTLLEHYRNPAAAFKVRDGSELERLFQQVRAGNQVTQSYVNPN